MKTRAPLLALGLVAAAGALVSCRGNRASVQIQQVCFPSDDCKFGSTCDIQFIGYPAVDADAGTGELWLFLQIENQLPDNADPTLGRLNTNDAHLDEVAVEYEGAPLPKDTYPLPNQRVPASGTAVVSVEPIRGSAAKAAILTAYSPTAQPRDMIAKVKLRGYFDDGSRFETGEFPVTIRVCTGCLPTNPCGAQAACPIAGMEPVACGTTG